MKKYTFIIFFFLTYYLSFSQTDSLTYYYNKGEIDKAITYGKNIITYYENNNLNNSENYIIGLEWLLNLSLQKNDLAQSEIYCIKLQNNLDESRNNQISLINSYYLIATFYFKKENYKQSKEHLKKGINICKNNKIEDVSLFYLVNLLNVIEVESEILPTNETIINLNLQLALSEKIFKKNSYEYFIAIGKIASYYMKIEDIKNAEEYILKTLDIAESLYGKTNDNYIIAINNVVRFYINYNNLINADFYNEIGLKIVLEKYGNRHKEYLNFLSDKATIKINLGKYKEAAKIYDECIGLAKDLYGRNSEFYGTMISNSVEPYLKLGGSFENAEKLFLIDLEITKKHYGLEHPKTAMCYTRLGNTNSSMKKDEIAIEYFLKAKQIFNDLKLENLEYANLLSFLGTEYLLIEKHEEAEKYYQESYLIKSERLKKNDLTKLIILNNLFLFNLKNNQTAQNSKYLIEYLNILKQNILEINSSFGESDILAFIKKTMPNNTYLSFLNFYQNNYSIINSSIYNCKSSAKSGLI